MPYGHISPISEEEEEEETEDEEEREVELKTEDEDMLIRANSSSLPDFPAKTGFAAWFVSNCRTVSRRENLVEELQSYLPPDSIHVGPTFVLTYLCR